jgi:hypothetical protein
VLRASIKLVCRISSYEFYLNGAIVYIDDTVIYGVNEEGFLNTLDRVLVAMAKANARLKSSKCLFGSIESLGHIFDATGMQLCGARVQGILDAPVRTSVKAVRSFIGMVNYFRNFVPNLI